MHKELRRRIPESHTAVLLLHGIVGSPAHFRSLIRLEAAVPEDMTLYNLCYPGHGDTVKAFGTSSMKAWRSHAFAAFEELAERHEQVVIVGHSMGALFAIDLACSYPEKIRGIMLLQCPLYVGLRLSGIKALLKLPFAAPDGTDPYAAAMALASGVTVERNLLGYIPWLPRILELLGEMRRTRKRLAGLPVPAAAFSSLRDELVSCRSGDLLRQRGIEVIELPESSHFYYMPEDQERMLACFAEFLK